MRITGTFPRGQPQGTLGLGLGLYPPCTLPFSLQIAGEKESVYLHRICNPHLGAAETIKNTDFHATTQAA